MEREGDFDDGPDWRQQEEVEMRRWHEEHNARKEERPMSNDLTIHEQPQPVQLGTLSAATPKALVAGATEAANALADVVRKARLSVRIQGRDYVRVEGWTTLGTMLGVVAREVETVARDDGSYVSTVELVRMSDGAVISRASAECGGPDEPVWNKRPPYARRSMAQTRATGKACRLAFSWIMALAGYEATPAEEIDGVVHQQQPTQQQQQQKKKGGLRKPTQAQLKRLFAIAREKGVDNDTLKAHIKRCYGVESTKELTLVQYEDLVSVLEKGLVQGKEQTIDANQQEHQQDVPFDDKLPEEW